jgi:hypothetical protein
MDMVSKDEETDGLGKYLPAESIIQSTSQRAAKAGSNAEKTRYSYSSSAQVWLEWTYMFT